jgi:hypothetical protein
MNGRLWQGKEECNNLLKELCIHFVSLFCEYFVNFTFILP